LHVLDLDTGHDRLLDRYRSHWQDLAWSPSARKLAYVEDASVHVMEVAHPERDTAVQANATSPSWSPGGRFIVYDRCGGGLASGIDVARTDGSHVRHLTRVGCSPAWSPDGSRIAYRVWCGIKVVTPTGRDLTPPSAWRCQHVGVAGAPTWSPDGRLIAIGGDGVFVMRRNGSGLTKIWDQPAQRPAWRPVARR
jgi:Tol biopolymer transport system component